jgi:O-antigen/teichoic acid export membrane protein
MSDTGSGHLDAAIALGIRVIGAALVFGLQVLLARLLPEDGYGGFVTLWTWMLALGSFAALGLAESSVRFLPRYEARKRTTKVLGFWRFGLVAVLAAGAGLAALGVVLALGIGLDGPGLTLLLVAIGLPVLGLEYYLEGIARGLGWFRLAAAPVYLLRPVLIGAGCLVLAGLGVTLTLPVVGAVLIASMTLVVLLMAVLLTLRLRALGPANGDISSRQRRMWLMASLPLLVLSGVDDLASYADVLVLSLLAEPEVVGVYFAAARSLALAGFVAYAMTLVSGRRFAVDLAVADRNTLQASIIQTTRLTFWATAVAVAGALVVGPWLLGAFGEGFVSGYGVMVILGCGMMVRAASGQAGEALIVMGRQRQGLVIGLCVLALIAALGLWLVPWFGATGAALAAALAMACRTLALAIVLWRTDRLKVISLGFPRLLRL